MILLKCKDGGVMNGNDYLLDSCFVLRSFAKANDAMQILKQNLILPSQCNISLITRIEVLGFAGLNETDERNLMDFISRFEQLPISEQVAIKTIEIRKNHKIKLPDALILATAQVYHLNLLTFDEKLQKFYQSTYS